MVVSIGWILGTQIKVFFVVQTERQVFSGFVEGTFKSQVQVRY
jgi:hypothetical protein